MTYVDGFIVAVPKANKEAYRAHAAKVAEVFKELGAARFIECWGDDVPPGKVTDFYRAVQAKEDEVVVFSWIEHPSRAARDACMEKARVDPRLQAMGPEMPFDGMRMIFGGFESIFEA